MGGAAKKIGNAVGTGLTLGTNKIKGSPTKKLGDFLGGVVTGGTSGQFRRLMPGGGGAGPTAQGGMENPAAVLAQTGGAPLLANVAMGVDPKQAVAGYFGASNFDEFYGSLSPEDKKLVDGVTGQLQTIQSNTNLRNQAVEKVVADFPNLAKQAASARMQAGGDFDEVTKGYMEKALGASAAKYAAQGGVSSGAMVEAAARTGADMGLKKLDYMANREDTSYNNALQGWQARYNETNALRNFQNLMTGQAAGQGFSAAQASLARNQQTNMANLGFVNQQNLQNQQNDNAMFGAIGGLAGTALGGFLGGPVGGAIGGQMGRMANSGASTGGMGTATDYGFSGPATPGYARNNINPRLNLR